MAKGDHVADVLAEVFKRGGMKRAVRRAEAVLLWPQVVGPDVARFTRARSLQDGVLFVEVNDSETSMHLMLQRQRFLDVYRAKFNVPDVREIRFRVGRVYVDETPPPAPEKVQVDPKDLSKLARQLGALELPETLARPTMQAAKAMLAYRAKKVAAGWQPCALCGALCETPKMCSTCQRYAKEPKVISASHVLATNPTEATPLLSEDERAVAVSLAKAYLQEKLQDLLPHVLADPRYKTQLESVARCYIAHQLGKHPDEVLDEDLDLLDARVARALGRWR